MQFSYQLGDNPEITPLRDDFMQRLTPDNVADQLTIPYTADGVAGDPLPPSPNPTHAAVLYLYENYKTYEYFLAVRGDIIIATHLSEPERSAFLYTYYLANIKL